MTDARNHYVCDRCGHYWRALDATACEECGNAYVWEWDNGHGAAQHAREHSAHVKRGFDGGLFRGARA